METYLILLRVTEFVFLFFFLRFSLWRNFKKEIKEEVESIELSASEVRLEMEIMTAQSHEDERRLDIISKAVEIVRGRLLDVEAKLRSTRVARSKGKES